MQRTLDYYFSYSGRISRSEFWLKFQLPALMFTLLPALIAGILVLTLFVHFFAAEYQHFFASVAMNGKPIGAAPSSPDGGQILADPIIRFVKSPVMSVAISLLSAVQIPVTILFIFGNIRRLHDRDKSGWWMLIVLIPLIGPIWLLIETSFIKGTKGPNRFGADPVM